MVSTASSLELVAPFTILELARTAAQTAFVILSNFFRTLLAFQATSEEQRGNGLLNEWNFDTTCLVWYPELTFVRLSVYKMRRTRLRNRSELIRRHSTAKQLPLSGKLSASQYSSVLVGSLSIAAN